MQFNWYYVQLNALISGDLIKQIGLPHRDEEKLSISICQLLKYQIEVNICLFCAKTLADNL